MPTGVGARMVVRHMSHVGGDVIGVGRATTVGEPSAANDAELSVYPVYAGSRPAALQAWVDQRSRQPGPYRPKFMVYSGLGSPRMTADRWALLQRLGAESFLLAADLPSQLGFDPDHELAHGQVGRAGASCTTLTDFAEICSGLDLAAADSVGMLANSIGNIGMAMAYCVLQDAGARDTGVMLQNDPLKEFTARGTEIFTPEQAVRIACDCVAFAIDNDVPGIAMTVCSNHLDVAGAGPTVALAVALADAIVYVDELIHRGYAVADVLGKLMFFLNERSDVYVTVALFRVARVIWADIVHRRWGLPPEAQPVMVQMGYAHGLESATEPMVNIPRITVSVLGAMTGGVDYLCASAYDEALRIPSIDAAALALRTMEVVACEHGASTTIDPLIGSVKLRDLEQRITEQVTAELQLIDEHGGGLGALRDGYISGRIDELRGRRERQVESGERPMVGHSVFADHAARPLFSGASSGEMVFAEMQRELEDRLVQHRARCDAGAVSASLTTVRDVAAGSGNIVPATITALRAGATVGDIVAATREGFGS